MPQLTQEGLRVVNDLAQQHGFSTDAITHMLFAMRAGNGSMAQFNHPEFAGSGQWMQGGMVMLGDMFNNSLKGRVDSLCQALGNLLLSQPGLLQTGSFQSQSQGGGGNYGQYQGNFSGSNNSGVGSSALFARDPEQEWWPKDLGSPNATGNQNSMRYAYFATARRLAVKVGGSVWVYDTQNHQIGGFSQQQGPGGTIQFSSQYGPVNLALLPVVSRDGQPVFAQPQQPPQTASAFATQETDIFSAIERLGTLKEKGILTDEEFKAKKAELLNRL